jgi:large subunit ribosomal protein L13
MKTYSPKAADIQEKWFHVDARGKTLGRLASHIAYVLRGKHLPTYAPHVNPQIFVVVTNAESIILTGNKKDEKQYYRHSGYPGGIRSLTARQMIDRKPDQVIELAVKRMLPKGALGHQLMRHLKVYAGEEHPHTAQMPETVEVEKVTGKGRKKSQVSG